MLPAQPNQSIIDAVTCMQAVARSKQPMGVREMARLLDIDRTRANRLLRTLAHMGLVRQTRQRKYLPGAGLHVLAAEALFHSGLISRAVEALAPLQRDADVVALGVLWGEQVCYLYHAAPDTPPTEALGRLRLYPASRSVIGRVLLAQKSDAALRELYKAGAIDSFNTRREFFAEMARIRRQNWARVDPEDPPRQSIATPVGDPPWAGVAVVLRERELEVDPWLERIRAAAERIDPGQLTLP